MAKYLVTGATGTIGSQVVKALLAKGESVRVGLRDVSKASALGVGEAEAVVLDYDKPETLKAAFAGVERVFLLTPFIEHFLPQVKAAVVAAKAAGVRFILRMSAFGANPESQDRLSRQHGQCELEVRESGMDWAVIQPTFFQDNFINFQAAAIKQQGAMYGASQGGKVPYVSSADVGAVAAEILAQPERHKGRTYTLTGPEALGDVEVAELMTKVAGRTIRFVDLQPETYLGGLKSQGLPDWMAEHLAALEEVKAKGWASGVSPAVKELLGREPERYEAFLLRHRSRLA